MSFAHPSFCVDVGSQHSIFPAVVIFLRDDTRLVALFLAAYRWCRELRGVIQYCLENDIYRTAALPKGASARRVPSFSIDNSLFCSFSASAGVLKESWRSHEHRQPRMHVFPKLSTVRGYV